VFSGLIFWPWFAGLAILTIGLLTHRKPVIGLNRESILAPGPVFFASALAPFGAEHLSNPRSLAGIVPVWLPARLFWAYFVGLALGKGTPASSIRMHPVWRRSLKRHLIFARIFALPRLPSSVRSGLWGQL
jgi:hypothetical protein